MHGDESKINACMLKENQGLWIDEMRAPKIDRRWYMEYIVKGFEDMVATRVPEETLRGIINIKRAIIPGTSIDNIEKSLVSH